MRSKLSKDDAHAPSTSNHLHSKRSLFPQYMRENIYQLLGRREICLRDKHSTIFLGGDTREYHMDSFGLKFEATKDAENSLNPCVEAESLRHLSSKYCSFLPHPRLTIAAAFSPDGKSLASTHGDHTVKITDWQTGRCLKNLIGHRRTPWVLYVWHYYMRGYAISPRIALKTRRSLRGVHFHPHAAPLLLTAEVKSQWS